ncbi:hypothetical protein [Sinomonas notoginsengisoli]|uniref:hypothetical protein n=1 Tax=Sinomonas notoginsengisoli TaxID=1457311 RepID=UPI0035570443
MGAIESACATVRGVYDAVEKDDPATTDILNQILLDLEKLAWMVRAEKEKTITP